MKSPKISPDSGSADERHSQTRAELTRNNAEKTALWIGGPVPLQAGRRKRPSADKGPVPLQAGRRKRPSAVTGFTLPEILVVLGIFGIILAFGLFISFDTFRGSSARAERDLIVSVLQKARSRAVANMYNCAEHGVRFDATEYVLFRDGVAPCVLNEEGYPVNQNYTITPPPPDEIVFDQLTGNVLAVYAGQVRVEGDGKCYVIDVNEKGGINWGSLCPI